jgi:hypothetical protein
MSTDEPHVFEYVDAGLRRLRVHPDGPGAHLFNASRPGTAGDATASVQIEDDEAARLIGVLLERIIERNPTQVRRVLLRLPDEPMDRLRALVDEVTDQRGRA